jgi:hypothetical protein
MGRAVMHDACGVSSQRETESLEQRQTTPFAGAPIADRGRNARGDHSNRVTDRRGVTFGRTIRPARSDSGPVRQDCVDCVANASCGRIIAPQCLEGRANERAMTCQPGCRIRGAEVSPPRHLRLCRPSLVVAGMSRGARYGRNVLRHCSMSALCVLWRAVSLRAQEDTRCALLDSSQQVHWLAEYRQNHES